MIHSEMQITKRQCEPDEQLNAVDKILVHACRSKSNHEISQRILTERLTAEYIQQTVIIQT